MKMTYTLSKDELTAILKEWLQKIQPNLTVDSVQFNYRTETCAYDQRESSYVFHEAVVTLV